VIPVTLKGVRPNLASDPSQSVVFSGTALDASGHLVTTGACQRAVTVAATAVTAADQSTLETWNGEILWYREDSGRKFAGLCANLTIGRQYDGHADITFTFTEKSISRHAAGRHDA